MWKQNGLHKSYEYRNDGRKVLVKEVEDYIRTPFPYGLLAMVIASVGAAVFILLKNFGM
jgi:hypothetical protein